MNSSCPPLHEPAPRPLRPQHHDLRLLTWPVDPRLGGGVASPPTGMAAWWQERGRRSGGHGGGRGQSKRQVCGGRALVERVIGKSVYEREREMMSVRRCFIMICYVISECKMIVGYGSRLKGKAT